MENKLLPCPFCGGEAKLWSHHYEEEDLTLWQVRCNRDLLGKKCYMNDSFVTFGTEEEAIESWNRRVERTCVMEKVFLYDDECVEGIECSECGWSDVHDHEDLMPERCPKCHAEVVE